MKGKIFSQKMPWKDALLFIVIHILYVYYVLILFLSKLKNHLLSRKIRNKLIKSGSPLSLCSSNKSPSTETSKIYAYEVVNHYF